jgi:putative membrane protein
VIVAWALAAAAVAYPVGAARRPPWPRARTASWFAGLAAVLAATVLLSGPAGPRHMAGHVLLGMVAPLFLVLAAPVTLALRALPVRRARLLSAALRRTRWLMFPPVAAVLDVGGLWLVYTTGLHQHPLVQVHVLAAGYLFTASLTGPDPMPHRASWPVRAATLVLASAAHAVLAKTLNSQVMYYGGDLVEVALAVALWREWLLRRGPRRPGRPEHTQVEQREQTADDRQQPHPAHRGRDGERGRPQRQHDERDPQPTRDGPHDRTLTHTGHAPIRGPGGFGAGKATTDE